MKLPHKFRHTLSLRSSRRLAGRAAESPCRFFQIILYILNQVPTSALLLFTCNAMIQFRVFVRATVVSLALPAYEYFLLRRPPLCSRVVPFLALHYNTLKFMCAVFTVIAVPPPVFRVLEIKTPLQVKTCAKSNI